MISASTWERIERRQLRGRERQSHRHRPGERPDPSRRVGTDLLPQIKHIVVLMMENHSFDNYLGTLGRGEGFPLGDDGTPDAENPDSDGTMIRAHHARSTVQADGAPCQSWSASHTQWAGGKMNGFVTSTAAGCARGRQDRRHGLLDRARICRSTTPWPGRSRWRIAGSARAWGRRSRTAGSCSPGPPTA